MSDIISPGDTLGMEPGATTTMPGHPREQLQVDNESTPNQEIRYPTGSKLWLTFASVLMVSFLHGLVRWLAAVEMCTEPYRILLLLLSRFQV